MGDAPSERYSVKRIIVHPNYGPKTWSNGHDVALLELGKSVNFETSYARPICLPTGNSDYAGAVATVTGFGRTGYNKPNSNFLQEVDIDVITTKQCKWYFGGLEEEAYRTMICAGKSDGTGGAWVILVAHSSPNNSEHMSKLEWPRLGPVNVIPMVSLRELQNLKIGLRATLTLATLPPALAHASIANYNEYLNKDNNASYNEYINKDNN